MGHRRRQWIRKIRVFALSESMARHHDSGSKTAIVVVQRSQGPTRQSVEHPRYADVPARRNRFFDGRPIQGVEIRKPVSIRGHGTAVSSLVIMRATSRTHVAGWSASRPSNDHLTHSGSRMSTSRSECPGGVSRSRHPERSEESRPGRSNAQVGRVLSSLKDFHYGEVRVRNVHVRRTGLRSGSVR